MQYNNVHCLSQCTQKCVIYINARTFIPFRTQLGERRAGRLIRYEATFNCMQTPSSGLCVITKVYVVAPKSFGLLAFVKLALYIVNTGHGK